MIPSFANVDELSNVVNVPPPRHFRPAGKVTEARWRPGIAIPSQGLTEAQKAGLRYEAKAQMHLREVLGKRYFVAPTLSFSNGESRICIPDGLFWASSVVFIFEIKIQHMAEAWWQLRKLYAPVVAAFPARYKVRCVEVVRVFDPSTPFPEKCHQISDLKSHCAASNSVEELGVYVWRP
jgi:hypothetical protein